MLVCTLLSYFTCFNINLHLMHHTVLIQSFHLHALYIMLLPSCNSCNTRVFSFSCVSYIIIKFKPGIKSINVINVGGVTYEGFTVVFTED